MLKLALALTLLPVATSAQLTSRGGNPFYTDLGPPYPSLLRLGDRATMGCTNADTMGSGAGATFSWAASPLFTNAWMERDAALSVCSPSGAAITGLSRTSDSTPGFAQKSAFGFNMFALADTPGVVAEGGYLEAWATAAAIGTPGRPGYVPPSQAYVLEGDAVNTIGPIYGNPYAFNPAGGAYGVLMGAGGGAGNGAKVFPASFGYGCTSNKTTFDNCIRINATALTGDDGVTGTADAIVMAKGHTIKWDFDQSGVAAGFIRSDGTAPGLGLVFNNAGLTVQDGKGAILAGVTPSGELSVPALTVTRPHTPASSAEACTPGQQGWDASYEYRCVARNTWKRVALSAW